MLAAYVPVAAEAESIGGNVHGSGRLELLRGVPAFSRLPEAIVEESAGLLREERRAAGGVLVTEGAQGNRLYLISAGHAEVSAGGFKGPTPLATLGPGEAKVLSSSGLARAGRSHLRPGCRSFVNFRASSFASGARAAQNSKASRSRAASTGPP